jgi:hypothetical protein
MMFSENRLPPRYPSAGQAFSGSCFEFWKLQSHPATTLGVRSIDHDRLGEYHGGTFVSCRDGGCAD